MSERPSIDLIIRAWKDEFGEARTSERGKSYVVIPNSKMMENLKSLAKKMMDCGYTFDEIDTPRVAVKIADAVWREDKIIKISVSDIKRAKISVTKDWEEAIAEYSGITFDKVEIEKVPYVPPKEYKKKEEKVLELNPKDRIKMDTSDMVEPEMDLEFLKELGVDESAVGDE